MSTTEEIALDQKHFDRAWDARERTRVNLEHAHEAAGGNQKVAVAVKKDAARMLEQLGDSDEAVAFGRIDPVADDPLYVGRHAITDENKDMLVVGWQAPAAAVFYKANIKDPCGLERVRKFSTELNAITLFEDTVFNELRERVDDLTQRFNQPVDDVLLRDLEASRDGEMRDIVQTIHHSQYDLISRPLEQLLVIQGGPGTGKSAVALHRVSWLLFDQRDTLKPSDFLVIGPSRTFTAYIQKVLPSLGNDGVVHGDLASLGPLASSDRAEPDHLARLKGEARMARLLGRGLMGRIRVPPEALVIGRGADAVTFEPTELGKQLTQVKRRAKTYRQGREGLRDWVTATANDRLNDQRNRLARTRVSIPPSQIDGIVERMWPSLTAASFLQDLFGSQQRLVDAAGADFTAAEVKDLYRPASERIASEQWTASDVALLDEAESQLGGRTTKHAHVVVDEAQDLSPMQLRSIRRRSTSGSFTIVGDVAQSTGPWARDSWDDIVAALEMSHEAHLEELEFGYRVPREHFELAARLLPTAAPGLRAPSVIRSAPAAPELIRVDDEDLVGRAIEVAQGYAGRGLSVGIISATQFRDHVVDELQRRDVRFTDARQGALGRSINVLTAEESKGLEFDATVVVQPAGIVDGTKVGERRLYIALTRTTGFMSLVMSLPVPALGVHGEALPESGPLVLEGPDDSQAETGEETFSEDSAPSSTALAPAASAKAKGGRVVALMADDLAAEIRSGLLPELWPAFIEALAERLQKDLN